jgi:hypothetical protein
VKARSARMRRQSRPSKCGCGTDCKGCHACVAKRACNRVDECNPHVMTMRYGRSPFIIVSMTCNPNWQEIRAHIPSDSHWTNCMDVVTRVFVQKFDALVDVIVGRSDQCWVMFIRSNCCPELCPERTCSSFSVPHC